MLKGLRKQTRGQSPLEYIVLLTLVLAALLGIQQYFKRGLSGQWKQHIDNLGDQYDPRVADSSVRHTLVSETNTEVLSMNVDGGWWTRRTDETESTERRFGSVTVRGY